MKAVLDRLIVLRNPINIVFFFFFKKKETRKMKYAVIEIKVEYKSIIMINKHNDKRAYR